MKKSLRLLSLFTVSFLMMTAGLDAQTVLCVDRDFGEDTGTGGYTNTWHQIDWALQANGITADYFYVAEYEDNGPSLTEMLNYDIVIWFTGEAWTDGATMTEEDETNLGDYLFNGGKLFMNAQDYLYDLYTSLGTFAPDQFPSYALGIDEVVQDVYHIEADGGISAPADTARFYGLPGSLADGLQFQTIDIFTTPTDEGLYGDSIAEHRGVGMMGIMWPYMSPGPAAIQYESPDFGFRTVFSTIDAAAMTDTVVRDIYMGRVIEWLMTGMVSTPELIPENARISVSPNPVRENVTISMTNDMDEVWIFNNQGQLVRHEIVGAPNLSLDLSDLAPGIYILKAKAGSYMVNEKILKQ